MVDGRKIAKNIKNEQNPWKNNKSVAKTSKTNGKTQKGSQNLQNQWKNQSVEQKLAKPKEKQELIPRTN